ncbi:MAG: polyvinylalcohol dehydrogenase [Planctomycetaceae bacterium]|nr:polyvinylalcohol dehydrogenase [Planctomycetaceae bacterium]|tara:strand:- start:621 stop:1919 length:1299 start_codon:yes stop_codon:yes gene_type:complete
MINRSLLFLTIVSLLCTSVFAVDGKPSSAARKEASKGNWSGWRGPTRDGLSAETGLQTEWAEGGPKLAWKVKGLGSGFSSVAVADGKIYTMGKKDQITKMFALSTNNGAVIWEADMGAGANPNCTPTVDGDRVYGLTHSGELVCINANNGAVVWQRNFPVDFKGRMESGWGYSESPVIDGDKLVCTPGGNSAVMVALNKSSGELLWSAEMPSATGGRGHDGAGYSSIVISEIADRKQYIQLTGRGVIGVDAESGNLLWTYNRIANGTANIPTPIVKDNYVFCSTGYGTGAALIQIHDRAGRFEVEEKYFLEAKKLQNHHGGMLLIGDYIYCGHGHNQGFPVCLNMMTGEYAWGPERGAGTGSAAILYADGHLYFRYQSGDMALIEATPTGYKLKGKFRTDEVNGKSWPHPVIAGKRLYLRDQGTLMVYDIAQ